MDAIATSPTSYQDGRGAKKNGQTDVVSGATYGADIHQQTVSNATSGCDDYGGIGWGGASVISPRRCLEELPENHPLVVVVDVVNGLKAWMIVIVVLPVPRKDHLVVACLF